MMPRPLDSFDCFIDGRSSVLRVVGEIRGYIFHHCDGCGKNSMQLPLDWQARGCNDMISAAQEMGWCQPDDNDAKEMAIAAGTK